MKRTILIVLGVILGIVVVSGTTYMITKSLLDKETQTEKEPENNNTSNNEPTNNEVTLTEDELETYLEYVPDILDKDKYTLNDIESEDLVNNALEFVSKSDIKKGTCTDNCPDIFNGLWEENGVKSYDYIEASLINNLLDKMYNLTLNDLKIDDDINLGAHSEAGNICPVYFNGNFAVGYCFSDGDFEREFKSYATTNEELIIYSYDAVISDGGYICHINDFENCVPGPDWGASIDKEKDYSLCKHTFKKNGTGYYWYSTEVVEG